MSAIKETAGAAGERFRREYEDVKDKVSDKADEVRAEREVKKAEDNLDTVQKKNKAKEELRDD